MDTPFEGNSEVKSLDKGQGNISRMGEFEGISSVTAYKETAHICNCVLMHLSVFLFCV